MRKLTSLIFSSSLLRLSRERAGYKSIFDNIGIPDSVTSIVGGSEYRGAFYRTAWYDNKPNGVVYAGKIAYAYKGDMPENTSLTLLEDTKGIADYAFSNCENLSSITISDSVTSIGEGAFLSRAMTSITIYDSVASIGSFAVGYYLNYGDYGEYIKIQDFIIYGAKGTAAETYAIENGFGFREIEHDSNDCTRHICSICGRTCPNLPHICIHPLCSRIQPCDNSDCSVCNSSDVSIDYAKLKGHI